jgi:SAM-dependent methyltransferase
VLTALQYRLLKSIAPTEPTHMSGAAYAGKSKLQALLGDRVLQDIAGHVVIDFGCGEGNESVEMARAGARVMGVDIREDFLKIARVNAARVGVADRCRFCSDAGEPADFIVSLDSFEHFADPLRMLRGMYKLLRPGGKLLASFGPTWFHPYGGHLFSVFPWAHLLFSERALIRWRADIRSDGATRFAEVAGGLNQMTIARFEQIVRQTDFRVVAIELIPIRRLRYLHCRLTREFTTSCVRCELERPVFDRHPRRPEFTQ